MSSRSVVALAFSVLAACAAVPNDPFARAEAAMRRGDLLSALRAYEQVPVGSVHHAIAGTAVIEIEQRLRRSHEVLLRGFVERANGHDRAALASFESARSIWPELPTIDAWIAATRDRVAATAAAVPATPVEGDHGGEAAADPLAGEVGPEQAATTAKPGLDQATQQELFGVAGEDPVALGLVAVETRLGKGELELAVIDLLELARRHPAEARIQLRLIRVLHQRALLRYGQGALTAAIGDWERVLAIQPHDRSVQALLEAARAEAAAPLR